MFRFGKLILRYLISHSPNPQSIYKVTHNSKDIEKPISTFTLI